MGIALHVHALKCKKMVVEVGSSVRRLSHVLCYFADQYPKWGVEKTTSVETS